MVVNICQLCLMGYDTRSQGNNFLCCFLCIEGGVMGYVNLSIYVGKTSKKVLGQKNFYGPVQELSKLKKRKILGP